ncbi:hypothetical protein [Mariniblastus fucicola]|uniref:Uncharacterized protein n=1 Tax=Mariniblastus fucicola TaxID=980251 RepID=A0A5B9P8M3_9BACT|nr:hypothetical protein [Mariniblastus fucicola]QEG21262.1 hypothetical protein MFFC18_11170 [Mariniblastus fucicola]
MSDQPVIIKKISWAELCPWTIIFRTLPVAVSVTVLALAMVGVLAASFTWWLSENLFVHGELEQDAAMAEVVRLNTSPYRSVFVDARTDTNALSILGARLSGPRAVFNQIKRPATYIFASKVKPTAVGGQNVRLGTSGFLYFLFGTVCSMAIWSFVGLAIARVCLLRLTRNETIGIDDAFDFAFDHWLASFGGVSIPLVAALALCIPASLIGLLMTFDLGAAIVSLLWPLVLALGGAMALLLLGLTYAWPLIVSSAACEGQNSFDAMTRAYAYVFQRPLHCLGYAVAAMLFGGFCWLIVANLSGSVINLSYWASSWGANVGSGEQPRIEVLQGLASDTETSSESMLSFAQNTIAFWNGLIRTIAAAFLYGLFWCMASAVYLLLRKDVDDTEMDEIFIVDEKRTYELPPLKSDETGVPQVQTPTPSDAPEETETGETESS